MRNHASILSPFMFLMMALSTVDSGAQDPPGRRYEVSITNLTKGQTFTPILVASHRQGVRIFELGAGASPELEAVAESGDTGPLAAVLEALPQVKDVQVIGGLLGPGDGCQPATHTALSVQNREVLAVVPVMNPEFSGTGLGDLERLVGEGPAHQDRVRPGDGQFLTGDGGNVFAQVLGVLDADTGQDAHFGVDHVGRIQPPSQPYLEDGGIDRLVCEQGERRGGGELEVGVGLRTSLLPEQGERGDIRYCKGELLFAGDLSVDGETLLDLLQVR